MSAFEDWKSERFYCTDWDDIIKRCPQELFAEAFEAGRAYQRDVDAELVENNNWYINLGNCRDRHTPMNTEVIAKAIREQKI